MAKANPLSAGLLIREEDNWEDPAPPRPVSTPADDDLAAAEANEALQQGVHLDHAEIRDEPEPLDEPEQAEEQPGTGTWDVQVHRIAGRQFVVVEHGGDEAQATAAQRRLLSAAHRRLIAGLADQAMEQEDTHRLWSLSTAGDAWRLAKPVDLLAVRNPASPHLVALQYGDLPGWVLFVNRKAFAMLPAAADLSLPLPADEDAALVQGLFDRRPPRRRQLVAA